jgi:hypothetical protein
MTVEGSADTAAQNNTAAAGDQNAQDAGAVGNVDGTSDANAQESKDTNISGQEESILQKEQEGLVPNRAEIDAAKQKKETEDKGVFSAEFADDLADKADGVDKTADADADAADADGKDTTEVKFTDFTLPEGVSLNEGAMKGFLPLAQEAKLTQEQAQKFVDIGGKIAEESMSLQETAHEQQTQDWIKESYNHPELGAGKRDQFKESMTFVDKAMRAFGDKDLVKSLIDSGFIHNPSLVLYFKKAGMAISEDNLVTSHGSGMSDDAKLRAMYPATNFD